MKIGEKIKAARKGLGLTQQELGGGEFTKGYISQLEKGIVNPSMKVLTALARRLNKPVSYFLDEGNRIGKERQEKYIEGENRYIQGEYAKALEAFDELVRGMDDPEDAFFALSLLYIGKCLYLTNRYAEGIESLHKAHGLITALNDYEKAVECHHYMGLCWFAMEDYERAIVEFEKGLSLIINKALNMPNIKAKLMLNTGTAHSNMGSYKTALGHFEKNRFHCQENSITETLMDCHMRMGYCSYRIGLYKEAKEHITSCIAINRLLKCDLLSIDMYHILALIVAKEGRFKTGFVLLSKSMELSKKIKYTYGLHSNMAAWVSLLMDSGDLKSALEYALSKLPDLECACNKIPLYLLQGHLGNLYLKMNETDKGVAILEAAIKNFQKKNMRQEVCSYSKILADAIIETKPALAKQYYNLSIEYSTN